MLDGACMQLSTCIVKNRCVLYLCLLIKNAFIVETDLRTVNMSDLEANNEQAESADEQLLMSSAETESVSSSSDSGILRL